MLDLLTAMATAMMAVRRTSTLIQVTVVPVAINVRWGKNASEASVLIVLQVQTARPARYVILPVTHVLIVLQVQTARAAKYALLLVARVLIVLQIQIVRAVENVIP